MWSWVNIQREEEWGNLMTSTGWKRWEWIFTRARDLNVPQVHWTGKTANRGETHSQRVLWIFREDRSRGRLQPINSHEAQSGNHLGGRETLACRARGEKHKKRGQNEALRITKCCTLQASALQCTDDVHRAPPNELWCKRRTNGAQQFEVLVLCLSASSAVAFLRKTNAHLCWFIKGRFLPRVFYKGRRSVQPSGVGRWYVCGVLHVCVCLILTV